MGNGIGVDKQRSHCGLEESARACDGTGCKCQIKISHVHRAYDYSGLFSPSQFIYLLTLLQRLQPWGLLQPPWILIFQTQFLCEIILEYVSRLKESNGDS